MECEYKGHHPELTAQVQGLSDRLHNVEAELKRSQDNRMTDFQMITERMGEVHEKVNKVAIQTAGLNGKLMVYGVLTTAAGGLMMFLLSGLFNHVAK